MSRSEYDESEWELLKSIDRQLNISGGETLSRIQGIQGTIEGAFKALVNIGNGVAILIVLAVVNTYHHW